jgi:hypothetical protein
MSNVARVQTRTNDALRWTLLVSLVIQAIFVSSQWMRGALNDVKDDDDSAAAAGSVSSTAVNDPWSALIGTGATATLGYWTEQLSKIKDTVTTNNNSTRSKEIDETTSSTKTSVWSLSLEDLVKTSKATPDQCNHNLMFMDDFVSKHDGSTTQIPQVIHVTGKTRCLPKVIHENLLTWKNIQNHSFYFHDDAAVDRLLQSDWPEFPQLQTLQHCMISGAAKADLWRYLVLYRYGGIYTDMDNAPTHDFFRGDNVTTIIAEDDDSFFVVETIGYLSQYFMATSPRHPIMYLSVLQVFHRLFDVEDIAKQYVPFVTGPGALKNAFIKFMLPEKRDGTVEEGRYVGAANRSITVVGTRRDSNKYVRRESVFGHQKANAYAQMQMTHFSKVAADKSLNLPCQFHLYNIANNA